MAVVLVAVTFSHTALMPLAGKPPAPSTDSVRIPPGPRGELPRVSRIRAGLTALNAPRPGTTAFDAAEAGPGPAELLPAVTVKVYAVASVRPGTLAHR